MSDTKKKRASASHGAKETKGRSKQIKSTSGSAHSKRHQVSDTVETWLCCHCHAFSTQFINLSCYECGHRTCKWCKCRQERINLGHDRYPVAKGQGAGAAFGPICKTGGDAKAENLSVQVATKSGTSSHLGVESERLAMSECQAAFQDVLVMVMEGLWQSWEGSKECVQPTSSQDRRGVHGNGAFTPSPGRGKGGRKGKRKASSNEDEDNDDVGKSGSGGEGDAPKRSKLDVPSRPHLWACPFFKSDQIRYHDCHALVLTTVAYVKQHIQRKHSNEIVGDREKEFNQRHPGKLSKKEQWYLMFTKLFPQQPRPSSPYQPQVIFVDGFESRESSSRFWSFLAADNYKRIFDEFRKVDEFSAMDSNALNEGIRKAVRILQHLQRFFEGDSSSSGITADPQLRPLYDQPQSSGHNVTRRTPEQAVPEDVPNLAMPSGSSSDQEQSPVGGPNPGRSTVSAVSGSVMPLRAFTNSYNVPAKAEDQYQGSQEIGDIDSCFPTSSTGAEELLDVTTWQDVEVSRELFGNTDYMYAEGTEDIDGLWPMYDDSVWD